MKSKKFIAIRNLADQSTLELFFLDVIQDSFDWFTGMETSKVQEIIDKVNFFQPRVIKLIIDSEGGDAQTGMSIYNFLKRTDARVETEIIGLAGSIASVIAMAANPGKLRIARNGFMMIHRAEGIVMGTSDEIRAGADVIDKYTTQIVDIYAQRTGRSNDEVAALIANGDYWMDGTQAVDQGFADVTFNDVPVNLNIAARLDLTVYKNFPASIRAQLGSNTGQPDDDNRSFLQNQFEDMKKFFTNVINALKGVKPGEGQPLTAEAIATAITQPFEQIGDEMDTQISNRVDSAVVSDAVIAKIVAKLPAPAPAVVPDVNAAVTAMLAAEGDNPIKTMVTNMVTEAVKPLTQKNKDLEQEIANLKGKPGTSGEGEGGGNSYQPKGNWTGKKATA